MATPLTTARRLRALPRLVSSPNEWRSWVIRLLVLRTAGNPYPSGANRHAPVNSDFPFLSDAKIDHNFLMTNGADRSALLVANGARFTADTVDILKMGNPSSPADALAWGVNSAVVVVSRLGPFSESPFLARIPDPRLTSLTPHSRAHPRTSSSPRPTSQLTAPPPPSSSGRAPPPSSAFSSSTPAGPALPPS